MNKNILVPAIIAFSITLLIIIIQSSNYSYIIPGIFKIYGKGHTTAYLDDYKIFRNRIVEGSKNSKPWPKHKLYNTIKPSKKLKDINTEYKTVAYLIILNDSIFFESYYDGYTKKTKSNSFSMAKSFVTAMLGKAIMEKKISSLNQKVGGFFNQFNNGKAYNLTVGDLASMSSGLDWKEEYYNPLNITTQAYFSKDIKKLVLDRKIISPPGKKYKYLSGNTQLLGMLISKAVGVPISNYFSEKIWKPIGASENALWQIDGSENGVEKAFCCFASNARDFARFGKLIKDNGKWGSKRILDSSFVKLATNPRFIESPEYGYGFWLTSFNDKSIISTRGHLGQYVIIIPEDDLIIVRLGHKTGKKEIGGYPKIYFNFIEEAYKMIPDNS